MELPSKKLLSKVLGYEILSVSSKIDYGYGDNYIFLTCKVGANEHHNIYELMHLMKEWAITKGYSTYVEYLPNRQKYFYVCKFHYIDEANNLSLSSHFFAEDTETKAVIKACEWILEQKESK